MEKTIASIDIGTNSVLLTIAGVTGGRIEAVHEAATITRLGEGLSTSKHLKPAAIARTVEALRKYKAACVERGVEEVYTIGTAAMRKAENSGEFIERVKKECGLDIEVISGGREAEISFKAVLRDFGRNVIVVDIGGGSTEFISPKPDGGLEISSIPLGCVTLHEKFAKSDPISAVDFNAMLIAIKTALRCQTPPAAPGMLVATAGTATTLAAMKLRLRKYSHSEVHGFELKRDDIRNIIDTLKELRVEERKRLAGLEPARADVILPGAMTLMEVMDKFGFNKVTVSDRGVRWGIIYERIFGVNKQPA